MKKTTTATTVTFTFTKDTLNLYANAYSAIYEIAKARTIEGAAINAARDNVAKSQDELNMATTLQALKERRIALKVAVERLETAQAVLDKLVSIQDEILKGVHEKLDDTDVFAAYRHYAVTRTEEARLEYIKAYAKSLKTDATPETVAKYMYFGLARNNAYKNKYTLKAESKTSFYDKLVRTTIDRLIDDGMIDTSKFTFTSKKLAKMEEKVKAYNNECMNK